MKKRTVSLFLCLLLLATLLPFSALAEGEDVNVRDKYTIMIPLWTTEVPTEDSVTWQALNELTGTQLELIFVPSDVYTERLTVLMASNQLPDAFVVLKNKDGTYVNAARGGMFWDLTEFIQESDVFSANYSPLILQNTAIDGRNYALPRTRVLARKAFCYRRDWLEASGLPKPETMEDIYNVIQNFAANDYDGNGKIDTIGLITAAGSNGSLWGMDIMPIYMGSGKDWVVQAENTLIPSFMTEPYLNTMKWLKRLYDENLLNKDFPTISSAKGFEMVASEMCGVFFGNSDEILTNFGTLLKAKQQENPDLKLEDIFDFTSAVISPTDNAVHTPGGSGFNGMFVFAKANLPTEADLRGILKVFEIIDSAEGQNLVNWGVEGVHYNLVDGKALPVDDSTFITNDVLTFQQLGLTGYTSQLYLPGDVDDFTARVNADQKEMAQYAVVNPVLPLSSDTDTEIGTMLTQNINDAIAQFVAGQLDEAGFQVAINQWLAEGGEAIIEEYNAAYQAAQN
ncbi:MAG TPA: extracellular solute-binding protein [Candidatus Limiplasma sp.]|nr:extracellular solute-binding protein [Candidatus Limiplasma sp.]